MRRFLVVTVSLAFILSCASAALADVVALALRHERSAVVDTYGQLASSTVNQRRDHFSELPGSLQGDVWMLHLQYFLADHDDLTNEQRSIIFEAMGLLASGLFETDQSSLKTNERFIKPMERLEARARVAFPKELLVSAFYTLGPEGRAVTVPRLRPRIEGLPVDDGTLDCNCHYATDGTGDFCDTVTNPDPHCHDNWYNCRRKEHGCGWLWWQQCNGSCAQ